MFTVYTKRPYGSKDPEDVCLRCIGVCNFLQTQNVDYRIVSLDDTEVSDEFKSRFPDYLSFPQVFWCDNRIGSSEDFFKFFNDNSEDFDFKPPELKKPHRYSWRKPQED